MRKNEFIFAISLFLFLLFGAACNGENTNIASIKVNQDSSYVTTFKDLSLGDIHDFKFSLPEGENKWITLWVEAYRDGVKDTESLISLSFGNYLNEVNEESLGFGLTELDSGEELAILYAPGVSTRAIIKDDSKGSGLNFWEYTVDENSVELEIGVTKVLAIYREVEGDSIEMIYRNDEQAVEDAIEQSNLAYLLKIMIEEE